MSEWVEDARHPRLGRYVLAVARPARNRWPDEPEEEDEEPERERRER